MRKIITIYYLSGETKNVSIENWTGNIYKVSISDDILASGGMGNTNSKQDYITTKKVEDIYKLNINNFVDTIKINKNAINANIEFNVVEKEVYMDYEIYTLKVKNNTEKSILLNNLQNPKSMYLKDKNNLKYLSYTHELSLGQLYLNARETRDIKIKYYNKFGSQKKITSVNFENVITDYKLYREDTSKYSNYINITINI